MDLLTLLETIKNAGKIAGELKDIGSDLLETMGASDVNRDTFHTWIYRDVTPNARKYFEIVNWTKGKNGKQKKVICGYREVNEIGFRQYFNEQTHLTWNDWQEVFNGLNDKGIIIFDADNEVVFYRSLQKHFFCTKNLPTSG